MCSTPVTQIGAARVFVIVEVLGVAARSVQGIPIAGWTACRNPFSDLETDSHLLAQSVNTRTTPYSLLISQSLVLPGSFVLRTFLQEHIQINTTRVKNVKLRQQQVSHPD